VKNLVRITKNILKTQEGGFKILCKLK